MKFVDNIFYDQFRILENLTGKSNSEVVLGLLQNAAAEVERETDVSIICFSLYRIVVRARAFHRGEINCANKYEY